MSKTVKYAIVFYGAGIFCLLIGLGLSASNSKEENIKYMFLFTGVGIVSLYSGLSWKKPSYPGGLVHKYSAICAGILCGLYSIYLLIKLL